jgi:hypothetical protein
MRVSSLLSNLTVAALLLHATLGCCWHHAHECQHALTAAGRAELAADCHGGGACGEHARPTEPAGKDRHGDDGCQIAPCAFVATQSGSTPLELLVQHLDTAAVAATDAAGHSEDCCGRELPSLSAGDCLAVRLHLLNRVLLI